MTAMESSLEAAKEIRKSVYRTAHFAGGGHLGASFSMADIISVLYFGGVLRYDAGKPDWEERDKLILSKGHACYALYAALARAGYFPEEELLHVGKPGSRFGGHPKRGDIPGVEASTGALGHGLSFAIGIAYADKADYCENGKEAFQRFPGKNARDAVDERNAEVPHTYVILGDGECQEGSVWEGALSAPNLKLGNLTAIVDHNKLQGMDRLENIVGMRPFAKKWEAFGWNVLEINGHDHPEIREALLERKKDMPTLIVANTVKGKGVSFMENVPIWHYRMPDEDELPVLMKELGLSADDFGENKS